jgi:hypothetical protein
MGLDLKKDITISKLKPTPWYMGSRKRKAQDDDIESPRLIFST